MLEMLAKMYATAKEMLIKEYGEQFTGMSEKAQAATVAKVLSDLVQVDPAIASMLAEKYVKEIA